MTRAAIVTAMPRIQRVEVYDEMARLGAVEFRVFYLQKLASGRRWSHEPRFAHDAVLVDERRIRGQLYLNPGLLRQVRAYRADLTVVTGYYAPAMQAVMVRETAARRPWVFWGEMAKTRYSEQPMFRSERLRDLARAAALFPVRHFAAEVWAIGSRAQRDYRRMVDRRIPVRDLPYFSDLDRFVAAGESRRPGERVRFLFCNSLIARKGFDAVIEAVELLAGAGCDFELIVAGAGPMGALIDRMDPAARARVIDRGFLELDAVPGVYAGADVLLYPSRHDGWGMGIAEGMAAAMPVIATDFAGAAIDMIEPERSGVRLDRVDGPTLAAAMRRFIDAPGDIAAIGEAAREAARAYDHRAGARRFTEMIETAASAARGPAAAAGGGA